MSDGSINVQSWEIWGYEPQGSIEIAAPEALRAVVAERKTRKIRPPSSAAFGGRPRLCYTLDEGKRGGKRGYKLSTETGQVHTARGDEPWRHASE